MQSNCSFHPGPIQMIHETHVFVRSSYHSDSVPSILTLPTPYLWIQSCQFERLPFIKRYYPFKLLNFLLLFLFFSLATQSLLIKYLSPITSNTCNDTVRTMGASPHRYRCRLRSRLHVLAFHSSLGTRTLQEHDQEQWYQRR